MLDIFLNKRIFRGKIIISIGKQCSIGRLEIPLKLNGTHVWTYKFREGLNKG